MDALEELMTRSVDDGTDRLEWLRARQGRVTASMIGKTMLGGASARREVIEASFEDPEEITGNRYIDRGHEREPVIAAWIAKKWPGMQPNQHLFHAAGNTRFAATPDCIGLGPDGDLFVGEIKTSKYDRDPNDPYFPRTGYYEQMQWQMFVSGAIATIFVWEQHDDDWDDGPTPLYDEPKYRWIYRDEEMIAKLVETAELILAERDAAAAARDEVDEGEAELEQLATEVLDARRAKALADAKLKEPWTRLMSAVAERVEFSKPAGRALVTWSNRTQETWEPDLEAALAATLPPHGNEIHATGQDLYDELQRLQAEWDAHQARYMKRVEKTIQKLTVTEPKPKAADFDGEF